MKNKTEFGSIADLTANNFKPEQVFQFWLAKKTLGSSYADDKKGVMVKKVFPHSKILKLEFKANVVNKEGRMESVIVRHCVGETEIFKHLQSPDDKVPKAMSYLTFVDGHKKILGSETQILKVLAMDDRNGSKPNRDKTVTPIYYLYDGNAAVEKAMKNEDMLFELQAKIRDPKNIDLLTAYARIILPPSEFDKVYGNYDLIKYRMLGLAKGNPVLFAQGLENPASLKKHYLLEAIDAGVIYINEATNGLYMRKTNELIQQAPMGLDPVNLFVDKITEDRTGSTMEMYKFILKQIHKDGDKIEVDEKVAKIYNPNTSADTEKADSDHFEFLLKEGKAAGLITKSGNGFVFRGKRGKGEMGFIQLLKSDPELTQALKEELEKLTIKS